jgi:hypothetical protein
MPYPNIKCKPTLTKETENIIKSLKTKDSHGYVKISTKLLKISCPFISSPLVKLSLLVVFPDRLKFSVIKSYKKGNKNNVSNYRPISLLTSFSKGFEKVMQSRLLKHLNKYNILSMEQYGFRTKLTTDKATYTLNNEVLKALNNKLIVGGIFCDLDKAFDCVNHDILLSKLEFYGISGRENVLYKSYLNDRLSINQIVLIYNKNHSYSTLSNWAKIKHCVPQGSILGSLLFLLYINNLPKIINNKSLPILFADDTSI